MCVCVCVCVYSAACQLNFDNQICGHKKGSIVRGDEGMDPDGNRIK